MRDDRDNKTYDKLHTGPLLDWIDQLRAGLSKVTYKRRSHKLSLFFEDWFLGKDYKSAKFGRCTHTTHSSHPDRDDINRASSTAASIDSSSSSFLMSESGSFLRNLRIAARASSLFPHDTNRRGDSDSQAIRSIQTMAYQQRKEYRSSRRLQGRT